MKSVLSVFIVIVAAMLVANNAAAYQQNTASKLTKIEQWDKYIAEVEEDVNHLKGILVKMDSAILVFKNGGILPEDHYLVYFNNKQDKLEVKRGYLLEALEELEHGLNLMEQEKVSLLINESI